MLILHIALCCRPANYRPGSFFWLGWGRRRPQPHCVRVEATNTNKDTRQTFKAAWPPRVDVVHLHLSFLYILHTLWLQPSYGALLIHYTVVMGCVFQYFLSPSRSKACVSAGRRGRPELEAEAGDDPKSPSRPNAGDIRSPISRGSGTRAKQRRAVPSPSNPNPYHPGSEHHLSNPR